MTGFYVRTKVDGTWGAYEVDQLPDPEMGEWASRLGEEAARDWCLALCRWIRENVRSEPAGSPGPARLDTDPGGTADFDHGADPGGR